ncbi:MAG TPA: hypothetical protein VEW94_07260 [Chloroflexia bacterium]|nr:hypothetical protein [Chloroflexia bacterium]
MRRFLAPITFGMAVICVLSACAGSPTPSSTPAAQTQGSVEITPIAEGASAREAIAQSKGSISWIEATAAGSDWSSYKQAPSAVGEAIRTASTELAGVDYASLSLPAFVTVTRALKLESVHFDSGEINADAFGERPQGQKWALYQWQGPEFPQLPDRELVHRWIYVYVLYDITSGKATHLLPTIHGAVWE